MSKSVEQFFADWEGDTFGFGYGSGELHILAALRLFLSHCVENINQYDYRKLEEAMGPAAAWLMINTLCHADMIEYGSSPRFGWLTPQGVALRRFLADRSDDAAITALDRGENDEICYKDYCNCETGKPCSKANPFWNTAAATQWLVADSKGDGR